MSLQQFKASTAALTAHRALNFSFHFYCFWVNVFRTFDGDTCVISHIPFLVQFVQLRACSEWSLLRHYTWDPNPLDRREREIGTFFNMAGEIITCLNEEYRRCFTYSTCSQTALPDNKYKMVFVANQPLLGPPPSNQPTLNMTVANHSQGDNSKTR